MLNPWAPYTCLWLATLVLGAKHSDLQPPADPFLDPAHDVFNPLRYIANDTLTAVAFSLYMSVALFMTFATIKWGGKYMLAMTIGAYTFSMGLGFRFGLHVKPESKGIYIAEDLLVVLSPCAFIAADYVLLARLVRHLGTGKYLLVNPKKLALIFISSDITTFLIQAAGGGLSISNDVTTALAGAHIFLAGLVLQLASFLVFTVVFLRWARCVRKQEPALWRRDSHLPWYRNWVTLARVIFISCLGILIRSGYRVAELSQGYVGHLATTEGFFYGLDTLPLFIAISVYVPFWPARFVPDGELKEDVGSSYDPSLKEQPSTQNGGQLVV